MPVEQALKDANLSVKDLNEVILVGGSTRIPAVQVRAPALVPGCLHGMTCLSWLYLEPALPCLWARQLITAACHGADWKQDACPWKVFRSEMGPSFMCRQTIFSPKSAMHWT